MCVTPRTGYRWVHRLHQRPHLELRARLGERPRSGRPRLASGVIDTLIARGLAEAPWQLGDRSTVGTAALLRPYLHDVQRSEVAPRRVSRALERLGIGKIKPLFTQSHPPGRSDMYDIFRGVVSFDMS